MQALDHLKWTSVDRTIFFDDDGNALGKAEADRLVKVASYDYWEPCQWDEVVNEKMMRRNPPDLADMVRRSVVEWGVAAPSYVRSHGGPVSAEEEKRDVRWSQQLLKKEQILLSFNKVTPRTPPPPSRTDWTRLVPPGHASSRLVREEGRGVSSQYGREGGGGSHRTPSSHHAPWACSKQNPESPNQEAFERPLRGRGGQLWCAAPGR